MPLLAPNPDGAGARFADAVGRRHPAVVFLLAALAGLLALWAASIAVGFAVVDGLLSGAAMRSADAELPQWLADNRSGTLTDISAVGSAIGGGFVLPVIVGCVALLFATRRMWIPAAYAVFGLMVESATYRVTSIANPRERPDVARLENLPVDASYPSGHTAAAVAVYAGLVLLVTSRFPDRRLRAALWTAAMMIAAAVAASRMYRGMHHPIDVVAGLLIGIAAIAVLVFACRAAAAASARRRIPAPPSGH